MSTVFIMEALHTLQRLSGGAVWLPLSSVLQFKLRGSHSPGKFSTVRHTLGVFNYFTVLVTENWTYTFSD